MGWISGQRELNEFAKLYSEIDKKALASRAGRAEWSTARLVPVHSEFATRKFIVLAGK